MIKNNQKGQMLILITIVVGLVLINTLVVLGGSQTFFQNSTYTIQASQALNLAEAGLDKAIASLNSSGGSYQGDSSLVLGNGVISVSITTPSANTKIIEATAYIPTKENPRVKRTIKATASKGIGMAFNYGVQVGEGGLEMEENSQINGSIYSNGNVILKNNAKVTGDVYVAGGMQATADQQADCSTPNCTDFLFGKNIGGQNRLDVAQSFKPSFSQYLGKIALKLRKIGSPSDITVRILMDKNGRPDEDEVLARGTLPASLVTSQYGFAEATFNSAPFLHQDVLYWLVLNTSSNNSNYWSWSADSLQGYTRGSAMWSEDWQAHNPNWNSTIVDLGFKTYMGGVVTSIVGGNSSSIVGGEAHANTLSNLTVSKGAYYQVKENVTAASYFPNSEDPAAKTMPISDSNIQAWKSQAEEGGIFTGNISNCRVTLGPGKYIGNISLNDHCTTIFKDPIWITGNLSLDNGVTIKLDSSYGSSSGVILVDGKITLSNNSRLQGTDTDGSYCVAVSTFDSRINGLKAIEVLNGGVEGVLYAPFGIVDVENNNHLTELTAWKIELENGVVVDYDNGLSSTFFSSGPSGAFSLVKGQYQIK